MRFSWVELVIVAPLAFLAGLLAGWRIRRWRIVRRPPDDPEGPAAEPRARP